MNLRRVDLNLLVVFEALMATRHVTRAAAKVGLTQPAMSNALRRLRATFGDELLVRTPVGMQPTPRALELIEPVRAVLNQIERVLEPDLDFDPMTSRRTFRIRLSDVLASLVLPAFLRDFDLLASRLVLDVAHMSPERTVDALERDEIDIGLSFGLSHGASILSEPLAQDRMLCVVRESHPFAGRAPALEEFIAAKHVRVSMSPTDLRFVDDMVNALGVRRKVVMNLPHWLVLPQVLAHSDLVAVMPERLFTALPMPGLVTCDLPFEAPGFDWSLYWHRRQDRNAAIRWLRNSLRHAMRDPA